MKTIGIIGGGASGLAAAIAAADSNKDARIFILEHKDEAGKKILATGNGRCNLTNEFMDGSCFRSESPEEVEAVLERFGFQDTLHFFAEIGLLVKSRNGFVYPASGQAASVRHVLLLAAEQRNIAIHTGVHVTEVYRNRKGFRILCGEGGRTFLADRLILACGGRAGQGQGSDGSGYTLAKAFGHSVIPVVPALVQLRAGRHPFAKAAGVRCDAKVTAYIDGKKTGEDTGELQITSYGISGIPVFQISRYIAKALYEKRRAEVEVDVIPSMSREAFYQLLTERVTARASLAAGELLTGIFHEKLIPQLLSLAGIHSHMTAEKLTEEHIGRLVHVCKYTKILIQDTNGFENAQVCAGGVDLREINTDTMESRYVKGLYLTGELLDADGICGGYNLQWAWATGYLAGRAAAALKEII